MAAGRSIRLFLVDGTPNGLLTAEIMNWTGHVLTGPRSKLAELLQRDECSRTGVYFLVGANPEDSLRPIVYVGESDDVGQRLKTHNRPEEQGGKDFWERVCLITSKDQNLTKAHIKHLESLLISIATAAGRCHLANGTAPDYVRLPESDRADMGYFVEQIRTVLPVLGLEFLRETMKPSQADALRSSPQPIARSPKFIYSIPRFGITAFAQEVEGEFFVLKGSKCRSAWIGVGSGYQSLFESLKQEGVLVPEPGNASVLIFSDDYAFNSPSAAAAVVSGRTANGRTSWLTETGGQSYAAWQEERLSSDVEQP